MLFLSLTLSGYGLVAYLLWRSLEHTKPLSAPLFYFSSLIGALSQGWLLYGWIEQGLGQNLSLVNLMSLFVWLAVLAFLFMSLRYPIRSLAILLYPAAMLASILPLLFPGQHVVYTGLDSALLLHILRSTFAMCFVTLAGLQAMLLALQHARLTRGAPFLGGIIPPIEYMSAFLFGVIGIAFAFLSFDLIALFALHPVAPEHFFWPKALLSVLAWIIFLGLLLGRQLLGVSIRTSVRGTWLGVLSLWIAYLTSQLA